MKLKAFNKANEYIDVINQMDGFIKCLNEGIRTVTFQTKRGTGVDLYSGIKGESLEIEERQSLIEDLVAELISLTKKSLADIKSKYEKKLEKL